MEARIDTIVIGAGQAGLAASRHLTERGIEHAVLERDRIGESWRSQRWDSFTLVTPAWMLRLPGFPYGGDGDCFLPRGEVVRYLESYAASFGAPVRLGVRVDAVRPQGDGTLQVRTEHGAYLADNVVVAVGTYQRPRIPALAIRIDPKVFQVHASAYRQPDALPEGDVLVVGSGQSAVQIADELLAAGRDVYMAVGRSRRAPRRYRGKDLFEWAHAGGLLDQTADQLDDPGDRFMPNPTTTGKAGGKTLGLHHLARDGARLLGRLEGADGTTLRFGDNLHETLGWADAFSREMKENVDTAIESGGLDVPPADPADDPHLTHGYDGPDVRELDLQEASIGSIAWATGFSFDFSWIEGPQYDAFGYPETERGITDQPGVYFVGLHYLHALKSALFYGVGDDAEHVVDHIAGRS